VIKPVRKRGLIALLKTMKSLKKGLPGIDDPVPTPNNSLGLAKISAWVILWRFRKCRCDKT